MLQLGHWHVPAQHIGVVAILEVLALAASEIGELDRDRVIAALDQAQPKLDLGSTGAAPRVDVPLAVLAPAKADRSVRCDHASADLVQRDGLPVRSEEHTSELQSLMRISYAVFSLQKK